MLLTNITNIVITSVQINLSNVIVGVRVLSAILAKFASEAMSAPFAKRHLWRTASGDNGDSVRGDRSRQRYQRCCSGETSLTSCPGLCFGGCS